jgi:FKBP-type peptidyl-prolyl cis-trans isomerase FklB
MKNPILIIALFIITLLLSTEPTQAQKKKKGDVPILTTQDSISYIIGTDVGGSFKKNQIEINVDVFVKGLTDAMKGNDSLISEAKKMAIMTKFQTELQAKQQANMTKEAEANKAIGKAFQDENRKKDGVKETSTGLQFKVIQEGTGKSPTASSKVTVNYEGKFIDGKIFDSSYERGQTATFPLNGVIKGWTEGLQLMKEGATYEFYIPSNLAYGDQGNQAIPGGSLLIFKVELLKVE